MGGETEPSTSYDSNLSTSSVSHHPHLPSSLLGDVTFVVRIDGPN